MTARAWTDPDFPPTLSSLINKECPSISRELQSSLEKQIEWKRAVDIWERPSIYSHGVSPNDVSQGMLGNCYFLAVLSSLAHSLDKI